MKKATCAHCDNVFEFEPVEIAGAIMFEPTLCEPCAFMAIVFREGGETPKEHAARLKKEWEALCPPLYRDTDPARLSPVYRNRVDGWKYGARGVGFLGPAGKRKTRAAFLLLRRHHFSGVKCDALSFTRFAKLTIDQFANDPHERAVARERLVRMQSAPLLLLDDVGKAKMTNQVEQELWDLLETRSANLLPLIWTGNATTEELELMMSADRGEPIIRRLLDFTEII